MSEAHRRHHPLLLLVLYLVAFVALNLVIDRIAPGGKLLDRWALPHAPLHAGVLVALLLAWRVERRPARELGFAPRGIVGGLGLGLGLGLALIAGTVGLLTMTRAATLTLASSEAHRGALRMLLIGLWGAAAEEILFRAITFRLLEEWLGSWFALASSALLFGLLHLGNDHASLFAGVAIAIEAGVLLAASYMLTRSLWLPIGIHWGWNWGEGTLFGATVSGHGGDAPRWLELASRGPSWWTGGEFGPEGGLAAILVCGSAGLALLIAARRRGQP